MASTGNPSQSGHILDMNKFFKSPNPVPEHSNITCSIPPPSSPSSSSSNPPYPPLIPSSSYPPRTGPFSFTPQSPGFYHHQNPPQINPYIPDFAFPNMLNQRSIPYSSPPLNSPSQNTQASNPNPGARLMAMLSVHPPSNVDLPLHFVQPSSSSGVLEHSQPATVPVSPSVTYTEANDSSTAPQRLPSRKLPRGRRLSGEHIVYDIDSRLYGEMQPQLEVTPITKYISDPQLVVGRQIAVNQTYICYGLKLGNIRILNINTALRSLFRGHAQRVTDMAFFAEDVHLLASVSIDGKVYVWKISQGPDEEDKPQISGNIVICLQFSGQGEITHPRICWHCHKQEVLVVGIGKNVMRIDTTKVGKLDGPRADEPLKCEVEKPIDGVQYVGKHDDEVTDLSMCQWMTTRLVSASMDGTIKIWEDRKSVPLIILRPHGGEPVYCAAFLTAPHRPDHVLLITAGPLNRELKIWVSTSEEGWLLPSEAESWNCMQTFDLRSSKDSNNEDAFFNQILPLPHVGLLLLANAKKNAIYTLHLDYGQNPAASRIDYMSEFTVTMPILSFTATNDVLSNGEFVVQVYCVQTQAIQQYALDFVLCMSPSVDTTGLHKSDSTASCDLTNNEVNVYLDSSECKKTEIPSLSVISKLYTQSCGVEILPPLGRCESTRTLGSKEYGSEVEINTVGFPSSGCNDTDVVCINPSPQLTRRSTGDHGGDYNVSYSGEVKMERNMGVAEISSIEGELKNEDSRVDIPSVQIPPLTFKHPTHLVTPSEILMATSSDGFVDGSMRDVEVNSEGCNTELELKVVGEMEPSSYTEFVSNGDAQKEDLDKEKHVFPKASSELCVVKSESDGRLFSEPLVVGGGREVETSYVLAESACGNGEEVTDSAKDESENISESARQPLQVSLLKNRKHKGKSSQPLPSTAPSGPSCSVESHNENQTILSMETAFYHVQVMKDTLDQLTTMQKELQKQITVAVTGPVTKESKRLEAALIRNMEKYVKANADSLWAHFQEENVKHDKLLRDRTQHLTTTVTNFMNKDLIAVVEKIVKKEIASVGPVLGRTINSTLEKTVASATADAFQRGVGDRAVSFLEKTINSKLEAIVARQIQAQFQTSGKQILHDVLKSTLESSVIPAFETSCKAMFEQVDSTFQKGMAEHTAASHQQYDSANLPVSVALREVICSASSMVQTLCGELADAQRKLLAFATVGAPSKTVNPLASHVSNGSLTTIYDQGEGQVDVREELRRLIRERKYEEAFTRALQRSDVSVVSWLCSQVDVKGILSGVPVVLSQGVLLSLVQQLACDITNDMGVKLGWMTEVAVVINPTDAMIVVHVRPILEQVYQILNHHRTLPSTPTFHLFNIRLVMHVINSMLTACK